MDIVLTKDEKFTESVQKSRKRLERANSEFLNSLGKGRGKGEWAVSVHFHKWFAEGNKGSDHEAYVQKICNDLRNAINRKFHGRYSSKKALFIPVVEGLGEFKSTHLHLILGNLGINDKRKVTKRLAEIFHRHRMIDVQLERVTKTKGCFARSHRRIRVEALKTGETVDPTESGVQASRGRDAGFKLTRIVDGGWAAYICKELKLKVKSSVLVEQIGVPQY